MKLRPVDWSGDAANLMRLDFSFCTERIYRLVRDNLSINLIEEAVNPPLLKRFSPLTEELDQLKRMRHAVLAEIDGIPVGFVTAGYEAWNRRAVIWGLYVSAEHRGLGTGKALVQSVAKFAEASGARCIWLETQNINLPAIQFYRALGFRWCGLDDSLFDPEGPAGNEVALFFMRDLKRGE